MITISALLLSVSAITVDPENICLPDKDSNNRLKMYAHCKKGDIIKVDTWTYYRLCDFKSGSEPNSDRKYRYTCVHRGKARTTSLAPKTIKKRSEHKKKKEELKKSGREKL